MENHDASTLRFWGLSFLFFGLVVAVLASAMDGSELSSGAGLAGGGVTIVIVGGLMTSVSFTSIGKGDSRN